MSSDALSVRQPEVNQGKKMVNLRAGSAAYRLLRKPKNPVSRTNLQKNGDIINHLSQKLNAG